MRNGLVVGREPQETERLTICDATMSRRHFRIGVEANVWSLDDLGSANGTFVNGRRVVTSRLGAGDVVRAGSSVMLVCDRAPAAALVPQHDDTVAVSASMGDVVRRLQSVAASKVPVFLVGETGVGKDHFASLLHRWSGRNGEFCVVNCAAIPETLAESLLFGSVKGSFTGAVRSEPGWFRRADGGTLFLDELGEMPLTMQVKLNRAIETGHVTAVGTTEVDSVEVRVVAATNRLSLLGGRDPGFRSDLLARLEDEVVTIPPLCERKEDILPLLLLAAQREGRSAANFQAAYVEKALLFPWPRNVRQLLKLTSGVARHLPENGVADEHDFDVRATKEANLSTPTCAAQEEHHGDEGDEVPLTAHAIRKALDRHGGNVSAAARTLGVNRRRLYRWMGYLGLAGEGAKEEPGSGEGDAG